MKVNVVWLKKDVRLHDHAPLYFASKSPHPVLILFLLEPSMMQTAESALRHWRFAYQGVKELKKRLGKKHLLILHAEALAAFRTIVNSYQIESILSHQETGLEITYRRDQAVRKWCKKQGIGWKTFERDGVRRNIADRKKWQEQWDQYMNNEIPPLDPDTLNTVIPEYDQFESDWLVLPEAVTHAVPGFQVGGETKALRLLDSFMKSRAKSYLKNLARPALSQDTCSRLSPYIAHGHISARFVYQRTASVKSKLGKNIDQFHNRLWWRCHYIQKLET